MTDPILQRRKQVQTSNCRGHWLTGSSWTFLTSRSHRHSIKKNHAGSTCRMDPSLRTLPHSHPGHASGWEGRIGKDTYSHRGGEGTKPYRVLHVCPGVWTMHGKTSKASGRRLPGQRGRKHGLVLHISAATGLRGHGLGAARLPQLAEGYVAILNA